jgi:TonB-dependent starch-binding outer membrane protein SusC
MKHEFHESGRRIRSTLLLLFLFLTGFTILSAQVTVTGTVTGDEDDAPIPGVNIVEKGTSNGTITSSDGTYSITVGSDAVLHYSFVGMVAQDIAVGNQTVIDVVLSSGAMDLEEIVVIGYGTAAKASLTGAVASVRGDELKQSPSTNFSNTLVGRVPGLFAYNRSGEP